MRNNNFYVLKKTVTKVQKLKDVKKIGVYIKAIDLVEVYSLKRSDIYNERMAINSKGGNNESCIQNPVLVLNAPEEAERS